MDGSVKKYFKNDKFAANIGAELIEVSEGRAVAKMTVSEFHHNSVGICQGGAIFTLADFAFAAASNSFGNIALSINLNICFIKAVVSGVLYAEAKLISKSKRVGTYEITVTDEQKNIIANLQGQVFIKEDKIDFKSEK